MTYRYTLISGFVPMFTEDREEGFLSELLLFSFSGSKVSPKVRKSKD